jgi:hypothetical protein
MIRSLFRIIGLLILAAGFIFLIADGVRTIGDQELRLTRLEQTWLDIDQTSLTAFKPAVLASSPQWVWDGLIAPILRQPTWGVLGIIGLVLLILFRKPKPLIGYSRR